MALISRTFARMALRIALASREWSPCLKLPLQSPCLCTHDCGTLHCGTLPPSGFEWERAGKTSVARAKRQHCSEISEIITNAKSAAGLEDVEAPRVARDGRRTPMVGHW